MLSKIVLLLLAVIVHDAVSKVEYEFVGCYKDKEARDLTLGPKWLESKHMTMKRCASLCKGSKYIGLQHADECHCGKKVGKYGLSKTGCKMACTGNKKEICGGFWHNSVYKKVKKVVPKHGYKFVGCYKDKEARDLTQGPKWLESKHMTLKRCASLCKGAKYIGLQHADECHCGKKVGKYGLSKTGCKMACTGNKKEICGGFWHNSVYKKVKNVNSKPDPKYVGCYVDKKKRDLNGKKYLNSSKMTIKKCARYCKGYKYMGVQYSTECYCDNKIGKYGKDKKGKKCNMKCKGAKRQTCGGRWRNSVYKL